jgi:precorrin isomerase
MPEKNEIKSEIKTEYVRPQEIEKRSFEIIAEELGAMGKEIPEDINRRICFCSQRMPWLNSCF